MMRRIVRLAAVALVMLGAKSAFAIIALNPAAVSAFPTQTTATVTAQIYRGSIIGTPTSLAILGAPPNVTTNPPVITYTTPTAGAVVTVTFQLVVGPNVPPGVYPLMVYNPADTAVGTAALQLTVQVPQATATALPNPVTVVAGGGSRPATVSTTTDPGFDVPITYTFTRFPAGIIAPLPQSVGIPYAPATFQFSAAPTMPAGTYAGAFITSYTDQSKIPVIFTQTFSVTVQPPPAPTAAISPNPVTLYQGAPAVNIAVTTTADPAFQLPITYSFGGFPGGITTGNQQVVNPPYGTVNFPFAAGAAVPPGTYPGTLTMTFGVATPTTQTYPMTVIVAPPPSFNMTVAPNPLLVYPGAPPKSVTVSTIPDAGFVGPVTYTFSGFPVGISTGAGQVVSPPFAPANFQFSASASVAPGTYTGTLTGQAPSVTGATITKTAPMIVIVQVPPTIGVTLTPGATTVVAAGAAQNVIVRTVPDPGFTATITYSFGGFPPGVIFSSSQTNSPPYPDLTFQVAAVATVPPGAYVGALSASYIGVAGTTVTRTFPVTLTVLPQPPTVGSIVPPSISTGSRHVVLRMSGERFRPGATVSTLAPGLSIEGVNVISPNLADVTVTARSDAGPGPAMLYLTNPDGGKSSEGALLFVFPIASMGGPLDVTTAAIVYPRPGTPIALDESVYPLALLATTGLGAVLGNWEFDGVPFDSFVAVSAGSGEPIKLTSHIPIPRSFIGDHTLQLRFQTPRSFVSPSIQVVYMFERFSRLMALAPREGAVIGTHPPTFRWSLVPGATGYEVEIERAGTPIPLRYRIGDAEWTPDARQLGEIGAGMRTWKVRGMFPGDVRGEATRPRAMAILPEKAALAIDPVVKEGEAGRVMRWTGGSPGLLYRVDFLASAGDRVLFSALAPRPEYTLSTHATYSGECLVRVTALGPDGEERGVSAPVPVALESGEAAARAFVLASTPAEVTSIRPARGAVVASVLPRLEARWDRRVKRGDIALVIDKLDVSALADVTPSSISYFPMLALDPGVHTARLVLASTVTTWNFVVDPQAPGSSQQANPAQPGAAGDPQTGTQPPPDTSVVPAPMVADPAASERRADWALNTAGTFTNVHEHTGSEPDAAHGQASSQADLSDGSLFAKETSDIAYRHNTSPPRQTLQESRNWLAQVGAKQQQGAFKQQLTAGYAAPSFTDQTEILNTGLARGGGEGQVVTPVGSLAYYESVDSRPGGVVAGNTGLEQKIKAAAFIAPGDQNKFLLRAVGMKITDEPGVNSSGGDGDVVGLFGRYTFGTGLSIVFEGAHGKFTPNAGSIEKERSGNAYHLGFTGMKDTLSYTVNLRRTNADFINPANRGLTPGGVSDREGGDLSITKSFGMSSLSLQAHHTQGGNTSGAQGPSMKESGGTLTYTTPIVQGVTLVLGTNLTQTKGDADHTLQLPATDTRVTGGNLTLSEIAGMLNFSQTLVYSKTSNKTMPTADMDISSATLTAGGAFGQIFRVDGVLTGTRSEGSATIGRTDGLTASVGPSWTLASWGLMVQPRAVYTQSKSSVTATESKSDQYQMMVTWTPKFLGSIVSLQASGDWNRSRVSGMPDPGFTHRYALVFGLHWGATRNAATQPAPPPVTSFSNPGPSSLAPNTGPIGTIAGLQPGRRL